MSFIRFFIAFSVKRPNLGCRELVQRSVGRICSALARELGSWQGDVKVRCSQLLVSVVLHSEDYITQHLQDILSAMYLAARDEDKIVVDNVSKISTYSIINHPIC